MARAGSYDHLISLIGLVLVFSCVGFAVKMTGEYAGESTKAFDVSTFVTGYTRPGSRPPPPVKPRSKDKKIVVTPEQKQLIDDRFEKAAALLHAKQYDYAIKALEEIVQIAPIPDAYVNLGYAYFDLGQYDTALSAFTRATNIKADQANAYYGLAETFEKMNDLEGAMGAMRTFIHISKQDSPFIAKARAALWEWEAQLGRIPGVVQAPPGTPGTPLIKKGPHKRKPDPK